jgi:sec-independent protein translocase protein TatB
MVTKGTLLSSTLSTASQSASPPGSARVACGTTVSPIAFRGEALSTVCLIVAAFSLRHYDERMSFSETIFLFFLALIIFGPKKLPEIARQAGKLLAELRRASNEFRSQIETEIAHLEVEKARAALPPSQPPQGTVASLSLNPAASESIPHAPESTATLAAPADEVAPPASNAPPVSTSGSSPDPVPEPDASTSQASHV